jgi:phage repressor protein C with HTH and peptisase S24 domain
MPEGKTPSGILRVMDVYDRRRAKLKELLVNVSAAELSRSSGVAASYISRCLREPGSEGYKNMGELVARKLEVGARKPEGWIDATDDETSVNQVSRFAEIDLTNNPDYPAIRRVRFKLSAGASGFAIEYQDDEDIPMVFGSGWFAKQNLKPDKLFAVNVSNGSMEPGLHHGDVVVVNTESTEPKDGIAFAVNYEGELIIKRLIRDAGDWWLSSDNPDQRRYPRKLCGEGVFLIGEIIQKQSQRI